MSLRSILIGFIFAMLVACGGHFNDVYMGQTYMVGNFLPISIIGFLVVLVLVLGPLLFWIRPRLSLNARELAIIVALPLAVSVVPGSGFLRTFTSVMVLPRHYEQLTPSWQRNEVLSYVPDNLLAAPPAEEDVEDVLGKFLQGMGTMDRRIELSDIPWQAWSEPLSFWIPLFLTLMIALVGLSLVLHRQWTSHEHLVYPVAEFVGLLTGKGEGRAFPAVVRNRLFWYGFAPVLLIHLVNGLNAWRPEFISIPHELDIGPLRELFPRLAAAEGSWGLFNIRVYFAVVAFSFFLPSDITLSLGLANPLAVLFSAAMITYGISMSDSWIADGEMQGLMFGAYAAMFIMILFSGRSYYRRVLQAAVGRPGAGADLEPSAVWGCRVFLLAAIAAIVMMTGMGLAWPYAILTALGLIIMFVVMSRICAETGLFFIQPGWQPVGVLLGLGGAAALGPRILAVAALVCLVISIDPREAMMPFVVNALRIAENAGVKRGRLAVIMTFVLAVGLVAGLVTVLWLQYDRGVGLEDSWATWSVPTMGFNLVDTQILGMRADGVMDQVEAATWIQRLRLIQPNNRFVAFLATGFLLFAICAFLRIRFPGWPLHPVLFLVWFVYPLRCFSWSFFIGWMVKSLVVKFGGGSVYQQFKPSMVGLIAGDLVGGLVFMVVGAVYYFVTGFAPSSFSIFPG